MEIKKTCINCKDRTADPNCHMTCEKYLQYKKDIAELRKRENEDKPHGVHWTDTQYKRLLSFTNERKYK